MHCGLFFLAPVWWISPHKITVFKKLLLFYSVMDKKNTMFTILVKHCKTKLYLQEIPAHDVNKEKRTTRTKNCSILLKHLLFLEAKNCILTVMVQKLLICICGLLGNLNTLIERLVLNGCNLREQT